MKKIVALFLFCSLQQWAFAQNLVFGGLLPAYSQTGRISDKIDYNIFVSMTINTFSQYANGVSYPAKVLQLYIQPSVIYKFSPNFNVAVSYVYQRNNPFTSDYSNEHRLWQQAVFGQNIQKTRITHRLRFEERFLQSGQTSDYPLATRLRYQLGIKLPLQGKILDKNEFYLNAYNESYLSLTGKKNAYYSGNWTYLGAGYNLGKMGKLEVGYLLEIGVRNKVQNLSFLNLLQVSWITNFSLPKKQKR